MIAPKGGLRMDGDRLVRDASPAWLRKGVAASLEALGIDYIDLYHTEFAAVLPAETVQPPMAPPRSPASACRPDLVLYEACASGS